MTLKWHRRGETNGQIGRAARWRERWRAKRRWRRPEVDSRLAVPIVCVLAGFLLYGAAGAGGGGTVSQGYLERGGYGEEPRTYEFLVDGPWEKAVECQVEIGSRQYTAEEAEQVFATIFQELPERMLGENPSLMEVRRDLNLPKEFPEYGVRAVWTSQEEEILDAQGKIADGASGEVLLRAELSDGIHRSAGLFSVCVLPPVLQEEQRISAFLQEWILEEEKRHPEETAVVLPGEYEGSPLTYRSRDEKEYVFFPLLGVTAAILLSVRERQRAEEKRKLRERKLLLAYADVVYQLMVFMGAGLTVGRAWERIVNHYEERKRAGRCLENPAYEEMAETWGQMQCGVPEGQAIREFAARCHIKPYRKLGSLLEQNRKTGTKDLLELFEQEMEQAWEQQKQLARQMGEEAQAKLLIPLMVMLLVVMVVIMVPAMLSMG